MQDDSYDEDYGGAEGGSRVARVKSALSTAIGALAAMALLMALGIWFYRLGVRDAQNVPIIRAAVEPSKTRPEDPGGLVTPHQDVQSYDVAGEQSATAAGAVVAPQAPAPKPEDLPMAALAPQTAEPEPQTPEPQSSESQPAEVTSPVRTEPETETAAAPAEPSAADAAETELAAATPESVEQPALPPIETVEEIKPVVTGGSDLAPARAPVAPNRPGDLRARQVAAVEAEQQSVTDLAERAANSAVQIQLAADTDEAKIRRNWKRIQAANSDILRGRALAVQSTQSGGRTFYRLRVGPFKDGAEARSVCQALKGRGQDCIVARNG